MLTWQKELRTRGEAVAAPPDAPPPGAEEAEPAEAPASLDVLPHGETSHDSVTVVEDAPPGTQRAALHRRLLHTWISLVVASLLSTTGLAVALAPLLGADFETLWPWAPTHWALLIAAPVALLALVLLLSLRLRRLSAQQKTLDLGLRAQVESFDRQAEVMTRGMQELEEEIVARREVERTLEAVAATLERQLEEEKREASRQEQHLAAAKRSTEIQNARLRELNKMAHEFVSHVSHEFRTPLTVIREYSTTMKEELVGDVTPEQYKYLETIIARVDDLIVMVNDVVDISSLEANILVAARSTCRAEDIVESARDVLERKAAAAGVRLVVRLDPGLPEVYCDAAKAVRVIVNLGVNAIKFSEAGKEVELWCRRSSDGAEVLIGVADHGPGIAPEHLERVFRCFEQLETSTRSSTKGFGLGLTIVRELVQLNFGRVDVESQVGKGSVFSFSLLVADPKRLLPLYVERVTATPRSGRTISLLRAATEAEADETMLKEIEHYLGRQTRRTDLVFAAGRGRWLVVAMTDRTGVDQMLQRLARGWSKVEGGAESNLPALRWRIAGCFDVEKRRDDFVRAFLAWSESDAAPASGGQPAPAAIPPSSTASKPRPAPSAPADNVHPAPPQADQDAAATRGKRPSPRGRDSR